jgi:hypothetical protein
MIAFLPGKVPQTLPKLTPAGRKSFTQYRKGLQSILGGKQ